MKFFDFKSRPKVAWLTVNRVCNFRCKWCYAESTDYQKSDEMSLSEALSSLDIVKKLNIKEVILIGGEPSLWEPLFDFNNICKSLGIKTTIITNGCAFGDDAFWNSYRQAPCNHINVSVKAISDEIFEKTVGNKNLLKQTSIGIERIFSKYPDSGASVVYSTLITNEEVVKIASFLKEKGCTHFSFSLCTTNFSNNHFFNDYTISIDQARQNTEFLYNKLLSMYQEGLLMELPLPLCVWNLDFVKRIYNNHNLLGPCHLNDRSGLIFDTNGDILPCNSMTEMKILSAGEYSDEKSLLESLNSDQLCSMYKELLRYPSTACSKCSYKDICRGGCVINWGVLSPEICKPFERR